MILEAEETIGGVVAHKLIEGGVFSLVLQENYTVCLPQPQFERYRVRLLEPMR